MPVSSRHPARFYEPSAWDSVSCRLCPHLCSIAPSRSGVCGIRSNRGGELYLDVYGKISQAEPASAETIPLYHYKPDSLWLRVSGKGCTMRCPFCSTFKVSQTGGVTTRPATPEGLAEEALERNCIGISFGINEPAPMQEWVEDVFRAARERGLATHIETGGMWTCDHFREILPLTDAVTLGIKSLNSDFLQQQLGADKSTVLKNLQILLALKKHVEITWLVIPGRDESPGAAELKALVESAEAEVPVILLPFEPSFTWRIQDHPPAELEDLQDAHRLFDRWPGLVYEHHPGSNCQDTRCPKCNRPLIRRGFAGLIMTPVPVREDSTAGCPGCGHQVPYVP